MKNDLYVELYKSVDLQSTLYTLAHCTSASVDIQSHANLYNKGNVIVDVPQIMIMFCFPTVVIIDFNYYVYGCHARFIFDVELLTKLLYSVIETIP